MTNWLTIKQLSAKRGIVESPLRSWITLEYINSLHNANFIILHEDKSIELTSEIASFVILRI